MNKDQTPSLSDGVYTVARTGAGVALSILIAHGVLPAGTDVAGVGLLDGIFNPILRDRARRFAENTEDKLVEANLPPRILSGDDVQLLTTVFVRAAREAMATHEKEKIEALQNVVLNTAKGIDIEEETKLLLLDIVTQLSTLHIRVLKYANSEVDIEQLNGHAVPIRRMWITRYSIAEEVFDQELYQRGSQEYERCSALSQTVATDLESRGLLNRPPPENISRILAESLEGRKHSPRQPSWQISPLGELLVRFIED